MHEITSNKTWQGWIEALRYILKEGSTVYDGRQRLKEVLNLVVEVEDPIERNYKIESLLPSKSVIEMMELTFRKEPDLGLGYSYGERIFAYEGHDQLQWAVDRLNRNPDSKSVTLTLLMPEKDLKAENIPCMVLLDFKKRKGALNLTAVFRSHDYGTKAYPNLIALGKLLEKTSNLTESRIGNLICHSISAHIYEADFRRVKRWVKMFNEKSSNS